MTTKVALVPPVAVSQTAPRLWPSPVAYSKLPRVTQTCLQVSDVNWLSEAVLIPSPTYLTSTCSIKVDCLKYISSYDLIWDCQSDHLWLAMTSLLNMQTKTQLISIYKDQSSALVQFCKPPFNCSCSFRLPD